MFLGGLPGSNWVFPGKKIEGYCRENETISESIPSVKKLSQSDSLKLAIPPLRGCPGPTMMFFTEYEIIQ